VKVQSPCTLRDRRLTVKPRIIVGKHVGFFVDRLVPSNHPSIRGVPETKHVDTLEEAIALAHAWAGPKPQEAK
jgi:hypothetical protein